MKKTENLKMIVLLISVLFILSTFAPVTFAAEDVDYGNVTTIELGHSSQYPHSICLENGKITLTGIPLVSDYEYIFFWLISEDDREEYRDLELRDGDGCASFDVKGVVPGKYRLYISHNSKSDIFLTPCINRAYVVIGDGKIQFYLPPSYYVNREFADNERNDEEALSFYLRSSSVIPADDERMMDTVRSITAGITEEYDKALKIHDWICENIHCNYDYCDGRDDNGYQTAVDVLQSKRGGNEGCTDLMVTLLRASGIPAKIVYGYRAYNTSPLPADASFATESTPHTWSEAYVDGRWIIIDVAEDISNFYTTGKYDSQNPCNIQQFFDINELLFSYTHMVDKNRNKDYPELCLYLDSSEYKYNGERKEMDGVTPVLIDETVFVPARAILEAVGGTVTYIPKTADSPAAIVCGIGETCAVMYIGSDELNVDGKAYNFGREPFLLNGTTFVELRTLLTAMGFNVRWDGNVDGEGVRVTVGYAS